MSALEELLEPPRWTRAITANSRVLSRITTYGPAQELASTMVEFGTGAVTDAILILPAGPGERS